MSYDVWRTDWLPPWESEPASTYRWKEDPRPCANCGTLHTGVGYLCDDCELKEIARATECLDCGAPIADRDWPYCDRCAEFRQRIAHGKGEEWK